MCVKQHFHACCTSSQSIETDSLTLICKRTWLLQLPHMSNASERLLCEPSTHPFCQTDLGADWVYHLVTLLSNYFATSVFHFRVWSQVSTFKWDSFTPAYFVAWICLEREDINMKYQTVNGSEKKYIVMDLAENVLYHETFFHKAINHSVEFRCCTLQRKDFTVNKRNSKSLQNSFLF